MELLHRIFTLLPMYNPTLRLAIIITRYMATVTFHNPWCGNAMQARPCPRETHASRGYAYANEATVSLTDLPVLLVAAGTLSCIMHKGHQAEAE